MSRSMLALAALVFAGLVATPVGATTDQSTFDKFVAKGAVDVSASLPDPLKPKVLCACTDTLPATPGFLVLLNGHVYCGKPGFDANGKLSVIAACQQFQALAR